MVGQRWLNLIYFVVIRSWSVVCCFDVYLSVIDQLVDISSALLFRVSSSEYLMKFQGETFLDVFQMQK